MPPIAALIADTLLVRPVDVPVPWYSVASGVLSIVVTLLLLGIAVALLGMARALKGAEKNLSGRMQGLTDELIPLARTLNGIATQLAEVTSEARRDLQKLSGTVGAVDDAVRDALADGEARLHQFGVMLDMVQDEAQATVASATGIMRGVRTGAGSLVSSLFSRQMADAPRATTRRSRRAHGEVPPRDDADVYARLAALEAAFASGTDDDDDDHVDVVATARGTNRFAETDDEEDTSDWDEEDALDDESDDALPDGEHQTDSDDVARDEEFDDDDDDDEFDEAEDDFEEEDEEDDADDPPRHRDTDDRAQAPRAGGPRIRPRRRA